MKNKQEVSIKDLIEGVEELEPETLRLLFPSFDSKDRQKIMALRVLRHTRAAYEDFDVFENICHIINDIEPSVTHTEGCYPEQIWYLISVIRKLFDGTIPELADEILEYIKFSHIDRGLQFFPPNIGIKNDKLEQVKDKATNGPFPLQEEPLDIQASYYLKIQEYLKYNV